MLCVSRMADNEKAFARRGLMLTSATKTKFENITNLTTDNIPPRLANAVLAEVLLPKNIMRFQRKKIRKQIEDVLNMYIETEKYPPEMINRILEIVKSEHIAKEHFRKQRDNAIIRYDNSKSNKHQISN